MRDKFKKHKYHKNNSNNAMDEFIMQPKCDPNSLKSKNLKLFSNKVFEFIKYHNSKSKNHNNENITKVFSSARLIVITNNKFNKYSAIDYVFGFNNIYILQYENPEKAAFAYTKYLEDPDIIYVEPDRVIKLINSKLLIPPKLTLHNYTSYHSWGFEYLNTEKAFDYILQNKTTDDLPQLVVGVIDDGIDADNQVFKDRILATHSFVGDSATSIISDMGHGTNVSSILIENTLENVKIISYKIFSERETTLSILRLAEIQAELDGVDFVNSSYGMLYEFESNIKKPLHIASAGNFKNDLPQYPAACKNVISVTGINNKGVLSDISTYGDWVSVAAPSENIKLPGLYNLDKYMEFNGTSCAVPFVTATCAMIKTQCPDLSNKQIKQVLFDSCIKTDIPIQYGIVNMYNAVTYFDDNIKPIDKLPVSAHENKEKETVMV